MEGGAAFKGKFKVGRPAALVIPLLPHYAALPVASAIYVGHARCVRHVGHGHDRIDLLDAFYVAIAVRSIQLGECPMLTGLFPFSCRSMIVPGGVRAGTEMTRNKRAGQR